MRRLSAGGAVALACAVLAPVATAASPRVLRVGTYHRIPGQYRTIQAAVDAAKPNDVILIAPGDYKTTSYRIVKGTDTGDLIKGPGIYSETSFPGIPGTTAIAGHRTTYLAPFREINFLKPGNHIMLFMPYAHFTYTVTGQWVVSPSDVRAAVSEVGYSRLVLSACTPVFTAEKRLLVYARLTRTVPVGAARLLPGGAVPQPIEAQPHPASAPTGGRESIPAMLVSLDPNSVSPLV